MNVRQSGHFCHTQRTILLVNLTGILFPDENRSLTEIPQMRYVLLPDDMTSFKGRPLEAVLHLCDVVTDCHSDGIFNFYFLHQIIPHNKIAVQHSHAI